MSLFENDAYQWRETYFILFPENRRPSAADVEQALKNLDSRYEIRDLRSTEAGHFESLTLISPDDYAAMDISTVSGDEVVEQTSELRDELLQSAISKEERQAVKRLESYRARFDVYHFEQLVFVGGESEEDEDDFMDPGALLIVMETIAALCGGIVVDPQANSIL